MLIKQSHFFITNLTKYSINTHPLKHYLKEEKGSYPKAIRTTIKIKSNLYMSGDHARYKDYRNKVSKLTRINKKKLYYPEQLEKDMGMS